LKRNERVFLAGDDEYGLRFRIRDQSAAGPRGRAQRGYLLASHIPKQIHKSPAVRVTQNIDAIRVSLVLLPGEFERGIEELEVTIAEFAGILLPAVARTFGIGDALDSGDSLHVHDHGFGPQFVNAKPSRGVLSVAAVSMKHKHNRRTRGRRRFRIGINQSLPLDAIDSKAF